MALHIVAGNLVVSLLLSALGPGAMALPPPYQSPSEAAKRALATTKTVSIDWQITYGTTKAPKTRFESLVKRLLTYAGRKIVKKTGAGEATLTVKLAMRPMGYPYKLRRCPIGTGKCRDTMTTLYTGARGQGTVELRPTAGGPGATVRWSNEIKPVNVPMMGKIDGRKPHNAPFRRLLGIDDIHVFGGVVERLVRLFHDVWGPQVLFKCLKHKHPGVRRAALRAIDDMRAAEAEPFKRALKAIAKKDNNEYARADARRQVKRRRW